MSFLSPAYFAFFPVTVLIYFLLPQKCRNLWLLICSWFFYACAGPEYLPFLVGSSIAVYFTARRLEKRPQKALLVFMLALFIGLLTLFKYLGFAAGVIKSALAVLGLDWTAAVPKLLLLAGISFYFFAAMGYLIDVYRGKVPAEKDFVKSALFLSFFPSLLSGPIARADRLLPQFEQRHEFSWRDVRVGLFRFAYGAFLKLLIADRLAVMVDTVFASPQSFGSLQVIAAACAFSIQIYCDFAAYSHMAIGSARAIGFKLTENFNTPYFSRSVAEFWRRWHISLSTWFRDYLYIPLGGNRCGLARQALNLLIVWSLTGFWHGAAWNFLLWGLYYGVLLVVEKFWLGKVLDKLPSLLRWLYTFFVVNLGWVKEGRYDRVLEEINAVKKACAGRLLKVIIETCLLTEEEKTELCRTVTRSDAEFIKTSTGFSTGGATFADVELMKAQMGEGKQIKAAGGISGFHDAETFIRLGADRLGTSRLAEQAKKKEVELDEEV